MKHIYRVEVTDTFGGESNYSWVRRHTITAKSDLAAVRKAKAAEGWSGVRCEREDYAKSCLSIVYGSDES